AQAINRGWRTRRPNNTISRCSHASSSRDAVRRRSASVASIKRGRYSIHAPSLRSTRAVTEEGPSRERAGIRALFRVGEHRPREPLEELAASLASARVVPEFDRLLRIGLSVIELAPLHAVVGADPMLRGHEAAHAH